MPKCTPCQLNNPDAAKLARATECGIKYAKDKGATMFAIVRMVNGAYTYKLPDEDMSSFEFINWVFI